MNRPTSASSRSCVSYSRWAAYLGAAVATSLGAAGNAEAEIHYSGFINVPFYKHRPRGSREQRRFDLGEVASMFFGRESFGRTEASDEFGIKGVLSVAVRGKGLFNVSHLNYGVAVSQGSFYQMKYDLAIFCTTGGGNAFGTPGEGYIGFRFDVGQGTQYGWARVNMRGRPTEKYFLEDYAWGDPGDSITTGQTSSAPAKLPLRPSSGSLGLLALGAMGVDAWRRRRNGR